MSLKNGTQVYQRLCQLFRQADDRYNSGLFHFRNEKDSTSSPDNLTLDLTIDDKTLKDIFKNLYYPDSPYEFSVFQADILGQVYERFLGKVIRLTPGNRAVVENKPKIKKAGGVYYTPTYIVDYIVKHTVGELVEGKKPGPRGAVSKLKILDPACGSGSFLIGAYQYLLDWHRDQYIADGPEKWAKGSKPRLYQVVGGGWRLTTDERKRILLNNIYGVDIDPQAVEVTKLSLLLKVLEDENSATIGKQLALFHERVLPDLGNNIKCGNSLIGPDFYERQQMSFLDEEEMYSINVFDWNAEFSEIMQDGAFDAVIGNPPYVRQELLGSLKSYFQRKYEVYHGVADLYAYFIEKSVSLLRSGGYFAYIVANKWMRANYGKPLRQWLKQQNIVEIIDFGDLPVFKQVTTYPCILVIKKTTPGTQFAATNVRTLDFHDLNVCVTENRHEVRQVALDDNGWALVNEKTQNLLDKLRNTGILLDKYVNGKIYRGVLTGRNDAFVIDAKTRDMLIAEDPKSEELIKPFLLGRNIKRYRRPRSEKYLIFTRRGISIDQYPAIKKYLRQYKERLAPRPVNWKGDKWSGRKQGSYQWYEIQDAIDYYNEFEKPKIIVPAIVKDASYILDNDKF